MVSSGSELWEHSLPFLITLPVADVRLSSLVDTGATHCAVGDAHVIKYGVTRQPCAPLNVKVAGGGTVFVTEQTVAKISLPNGRRTKVQAYVLPAILSKNIGMILGCDWL